MQFVSNPQFLCRPSTAGQTNRQTHSSSRGERVLYVLGAGGLRYFFTAPKSVLLFLKDSRSHLHFPSCTLSLSLREWIHTCRQPISVVFRIHSTIKCRNENLWYQYIQEEIEEVEEDKTKDNYNAERIKQANIYNDI